jgi:hypothetical protein
MLTQEQINLILQEAANNPRVQTVLLAGSYAYGNPHPQSDLDVRCITNDGTDWPEKKVKFNTEIEIFYNTPERIMEYFEEDQTCNDAACISAWDQGILFYDANGTGSKLKNLAAKIFKKGPHHGTWIKNPKYNI